MSDSEGNGFDDQEMENGHISTSTPLNLSGDSDGDDDEVNAQNETGTFNIDLPTSHKYLGKLNDIGGYTLFDDGEILSILAIHTNTLVFPGFTLPLVLNNHYEGNVMQHFIENQKVFVLLVEDEYNNGRIYDYGVTMEIFETDVKSNTLCLKARGRQRCELVPNSEIKHLAGRLQTVTVRILPEFKILSPLSDTQLYMLKSKRKYVSADYEEVKSCRKFRRYHLAQFPFPDWIYNRCELSYFVKEILNGLVKYYPIEYVPRDPLLLSYWFAQNFLLDHQERLTILEKKSMWDRLKLEMQFVRVERNIQCSNCRTDIARQEDIFVMSKEGVQSNYCNPGGYVYETVTVSQATNFQLAGLPSKQFSWFPGYAWTIMQCSHCRHHLGWKFTSETLKPKFFYGLAKSNFEIVRDPKALDLIYQSEVH